MYQSVVSEGVVINCSLTLVNHRAFDIIDYCSQVYQE